MDGLGLSAIGRPEKRVTSISPMARPVAATLELSAGDHDTKRRDFAIWSLIARQSGRAIGSPCCRFDGVPALLYRSAVLVPEVALPTHDPAPAAAGDTRSEAADRVLRSGSASTILSNLGIVLPHDRVTLGEMVDALGGAGIGLTLLMLALPSFIPIPGLPTGVVFGAALAILSVQIMMGAESLVLPERLRRFSLPRGPVVKGGLWIAPWFRRIEWLLRPRLPSLSGRVARFVLAVPILVHAIMILLPIPLGNQLPSLAVIAFAFGLIERDGVAILVGAVLSIVALAWNTAIIVFGAELSVLAYRWAGRLLEAF